MSETNEQPQTTVVTEETDVILMSIDSLVNRLEETVKNTKVIATELKGLKKEYAKNVKKIAGTRKKKVQRDPDAPKKAPSGFAKPTKISAELATFLGVSEGEMIARPDVTKGITRYVKENNLQNESNKREIDLSKPGGKILTDLLNVPEGEKLTFFNLQKYLKIHFPTTQKEAKTLGATAVEKKKAKTTKLEIHVDEEAPVPTEVPATEVPTEEPKVRVRRKTKEVAAVTEVAAHV
jgi:upstream activation factor subunit UAF30